jgi:hypothetical protein
VDLPKGSKERYRAQRGSRAGWVARDQQRSAGPLFVLGELHGLGLAPKEIGCF